MSALRSLTLITVASIMLVGCAWITPSFQSFTPGESARATTAPLPNVHPTELVFPTAPLVPTAPRVTTPPGPVVTAMPIFSAEPYEPTGTPQAVSQPIDQLGAPPRAPTPTAPRTGSRPARA